MSSETSNNSASIWSRGSSLYLKTKIFDASVHAALKEMKESGHARWIPEIKAWAVSSPQKGSCYGRLRKVLRLANWKISPDAGEILREAEKSHRSIAIKEGEMQYEGEIPVLLEPAPHQRVAVNWFLHGQGRAFLRDAPGSGKSLLPFSLLAMGKFERIFVACSKALVPTWEWLAGKSLERAEISVFSSGKWRGSRDSNVFLCPYDSWDRALEEAEVKGSLLVVDESHRCGSASGKRYKKLKKASRAFGSVLFVSGNRPEDDPEAFFNEMSLAWPEISKTRLMKYYSCGRPGKFLASRQIDWERLYGDLGGNYLRRESFTGMPQTTLKRDTIAPGQESLSLYKKELQETLLRRAGVDARAVAHLLELCGRIKQKRAEKLAYDLARDRNVLVVYRFEKAGKFWENTFRVTPENAYSFKGKIALGKAGELQEGVDLSHFDAMLVVDPFAGPSQRKQMAARLSRLSRKLPVLVVEMCVEGMIDSLVTSLPQMPAKAQLKAIQNKICK